VTDILALVPTLRAMAAAGLLLLIHGESTDQSVDIFERELAFLPTLAKLLEAVPTLRIVLEHITTAEGVAFVREHAQRGAKLAATITAHHLLLSRPPSTAFPCSSTRTTGARCWMRC
jgi:dihydroorotase